MSDDEKKKKPPTAVEVLKRQKEREAEENQARAAKEAHEARRKAEEAAKKETEAADLVKSSFGELVAEASAMNGVRFVAVARVRGEIPPVLASFTQEINNAGYACELAHLKFDSSPCEVRHGSKKGWMPTIVPAIGQGAEYQYLLVSWGD